MAGQRTGGKSGGPRKMLVVLVLVGAVVLLHRVGARGEGDLDPTAMLALGFVILASYTFGELVELVRLPHITGYLVAGMALGPSAAAILSGWLGPGEYAPLDRGILSEGVIEQLAPLNTLAVSLIALTAGGELKVANLRRGLRSIVSVLGGQLLFIPVFTLGFLFAVSGWIPAIAFPPFGGLDVPTMLALASILGTISIATSPAATLAVINDTGARGAYTERILAIVVLKDVVVVVLFALVSTLAAQALLEASGATDHTDLGMYLLQHVGGALLLGMAIGFGTAQYLRYIGAEVLLFLVGVVYIGALLAGVLELDAVVLFLAAGFAAANFSSEGDRLLATVETLSLPVYAVFFTLAGAHLPLADLAALAPFAVALVLMRALGIWVGARLGGHLGRAPTSVTRYGWLGFVSQAGVAISLAEIVGERFGEVGADLRNLIIAGIALNELVGPVLLKIGLELSGETRATETEDEAAEADDEAEAASDVDAPALEPWPVPQRAADAWGKPARDLPADVQSHVRELQLDLAQVVREVAEQPLLSFRQRAIEFLRELRREFLRHHRRVVVAAEVEDEGPAPSEVIRREQARLAEKWRLAVLERSSRVKREPDWEPAPILDAVDAVLEGVPERVRIPIPDEVFRPRSGDSFAVRVQRSWLRFRRGAARLFAETLAPRAVQLRNLARYHLWGTLPGRLEPVAALHTQAESHLAARVRSIFDGLGLAYDELASVAEDRRMAEPEEAALGDALRGPVLEERLHDLRRSTEEELGLAIEEVDRIAEDLLERTSRAIGGCLKALKADLGVIGTPDLPPRRRAVSRLYARRGETLSGLRRGTAAGRATASAIYARLALEMELSSLEGRVRDVLEDHALRLGKDVRGRTFLQVQRVLEAIELAQAAMAELLGRDRPGAELAKAVKEVMEPVVRVTAEAARLSTQLQEQLADDEGVAKLLDALTRAAQGLSSTYRIPAGPVPRAEEKLPPPVGTVDVPFREWVLARIDTALAPGLVAAMQDVAVRVEPLGQALSDLERRVAFNLELALGELSVVPDEPPSKATKTLVGDLINGALDRNRELFEGYVVTSRGWGEAAREAVRGSVLSGLAELRASLVDGQIGRLRVQMVRDVGTRRLAQTLSDVRRSSRRAFGILRRAVAEATGERRIDTARQWLGLPPRAAQLADEHGFDPPEPRPGIPMVYRRLFSAQALEAGDILTGRDEALGQARRILEGQERGPLRTVAIVGPDGVGKSAFVNALVRSQRLSKVRRLTFDRPATVREVETQLDALHEGQVVVVRGLHWLRSLRPGGYAPLRRLMEGLMADGGKNAFICRADTLVWDQLRHAAALDETFPETIRLDPLDEEALTAAVLARHRVSGHGLVFRQAEAPESRLEELALRLVAPLSRPRQAFFRALHAASGGLLRDALRLWLASVEEVDEAADFVHLGPVPRTRIAALRRLSDPTVLLLFQVSRQGWMTPEVYGSLFRVERHRAAARLAALEHTGLLERRPGGWRVALHLRGAVHRLFRERGFLP